MRLKVVTSAFLVIGFGLLFAWPQMLAMRPPHGAPRAEFKQYGWKLLAFTGCVIVTFSGATLGAIFIVKSAREEFKRQSLENMQQLIEDSRKEVSHHRDSRES